jgi:hypothetical protein
MIKTARPSEPPSASFNETLARVLSMARKAQESEELKVALRSELQGATDEVESASEHPAEHRSRSARLGARTNEPASQCHGAARCVSPLRYANAVRAVSRTRLGGGLCRQADAGCTHGRPRSRRRQRPSVYERAWSRFGRELASSEPGEWSWFACYKGRSRVVEKLYVRHGKGAWWSFATGLDRPLREQIDVDRRRSKSARGSSDGSSLESLLNQEGSPSRRALLRALTSVHARLGKVRSDPEPAAPRV